MILKLVPELKVLLSNPKKIVLVGHKNPDGDAIGSTLALYHYLNQYNHNVQIIVPNDYPKFLKWMPGQNVILNYEFNNEKSNDIITNAEVIFTLDFNALHRTGDMELILKQAKAIKIMIDHHQQPDDYATFTFSDTNFSSTCEMVYRFIEMLGDTNKITNNIASCLYTGIVTDTGSFKFSSTSSDTHRIVADLIDKGAVNYTIHSNLFDTNSETRLQLLGAALKNMAVLHNFKTAYISLSQDQLNTYNFKKGDTEGFVNYGLSIDGIIFAAIFIESKEEGIIKISFRSKGNFSVNQFARAHFNGGGHDNAAGGKSELSLQETITKFITILPQYKDELSA